MFCFKQQRVWVDPICLSSQARRGMLPLPKRERRRKRFPWENSWGCRQREIHGQVTMKMNSWLPQLMVVRETPQTGDLVGVLAGAQGRQVWPRFPPFSFPVFLWQVAAKGREALVVPKCFLIDPLSPSTLATLHFPQPRMKFRNSSAMWRCALLCQFSAFHCTLRAVLFL